MSNGTFTNPSTKILSRIILMSTNLKNLKNTQLCKLITEQEITKHKKRKPIVEKMFIISLLVSTNS